MCLCGSLAVKMFHLSAASCQDAPSLGRESHSVFVRPLMCGLCGSLAVKMFHLSAASCQDAPSLGRESHFEFTCA